MNRTAYQLTTGTQGGLSLSNSTGSFSLYGFWLDEKPTLSTPEPAYNNLLVSIPHTDVQLDFSRVAGATHYPNGRDMTYKLRKINKSSPGAIVSDVNSLVAWLTGLQQTTIGDDWSGRSWEGSSVTGVSVDYYRDGWEATVTVNVHSTHARDVNGNL